MLHNVCTITTIYNANTMSSSMRHMLRSTSSMRHMLRSTINLLISRPVIPYAITEAIIVPRVRDEDLIYVVVKR